MNAYIIPGLSEKRNSELMDFANVVCEYYGLKFEDILKKSRKQQYVKDRSFIAKYAHDYTKISLHGIAKFMSPAIKEHCMVLHYVKKANNYFETEANFRKEYVDVLVKYREVKNRFDDNYSLFFKRSDKVVKSISN